MFSVGGPSFLRIACGTVFWLLFLIAPASSESCGWCGCKGPGYRGPDGHCIGWKQFARICGNPPSAHCKYEGNKNGPASKDSTSQSAPNSPSDAEKRTTAKPEPASDSDAPAAEPPKPNEQRQNSEPPKQPEPPKDDGKQHLGAALPPLNVAVTEETLQSTTCVRGWTTTVSCRDGGLFP